MKEGYPIFEHWYRTLDWILSTVENFPRNARFSVASRIADAALDTMECLIEAIYTRDRTHILDRINRASHGLSFLGMRVFPGTIRVCSANYRRSRRRIHQGFQAWARDEKSDAALAQAVTSSIGYLRYFAPGMAISVQSC